MAGAEAEGRRESEAEAEDEWASEAEGAPLTITPPLDTHRLDAEESGLGQKGIEPKVRAQMRSPIQKGLTKPLFRCYDSM